MTKNKPDYIVNEVDEDALTIDWFFGQKNVGLKLRQLVLITIGWIACLVPISITVILILFKDKAIPIDQTLFTELFDTIINTFLQYYLFFIAFFLILHIYNLILSNNRLKNDIESYDSKLLKKHTDLAEEMYYSKYGPRDHREGQNKIIIQDYADIGTFELRQQFDYFGDEDEDDF
ncbi:hypothetical protein ACE83Q_06210 [Dellaglioa sp. P0083]|uniref:hypothetical protein n=1 Tax=Dellaglioa kimchii TaxID=3344667 RepID=UPI0038D4EE5A